MEEVKYNNQGVKMWVKEYRKHDDIDVEFEDGFVFYHASMGNFKKGTIRSGYYPSVYGVGYIGYSKTKDENGKPNKSYIAWNNMMKRCYDDNYKEERSSYKDCFVCNEWHNYSNFKEWYDKNYYEIDNEMMYLDKDILFKGNKMYSPITCMFVNNRINYLILDNKSKNSKYPTGVSKRGSKYSARLRKGNKDRTRVEIGVYDTVEEAYESYKAAKEEYIKEVAEEYKDKIPNNLYQSLINWEI